MSAVQSSQEARLEAMTADHLDAVLAVEQVAYSHPWTRGNFIDSMRVGYHCQCLVGPAPGGSPATLAQPVRFGAGDALIGYFVAM